jgi:xanthine permease XanP
MAMQWVREYLGRSLDRRMVRPAGTAYWLDDRPPQVVTAALALQHVAIQSVFFVIPALLAGMLSSDPTDAVRFLSLSILAAALWQALMILTRGPIGSGYPLPASHAIAVVGAYSLLAQTGAGFGAAGAMLAITGFVGVVLTFALHRLRLVLPNEVSGVVVMLIGVALLVLSTDRLGLRGESMPQAAPVWVALASIGVMVAVSLSRTRAAPFAVLIGATLGSCLSIWQGLVNPDAAALIAAQPWLALPEPWLPRFDQVSLAPLGAFMVTLLALKATAVGTLVALQRNLDANWSKPDAPPIRRGLLANGLGIMAAGLVGAACPNPNSPAMGLSIATGTLARRIVWVGSLLLVALALCPKAVVLFVLVPEPVKAAMLFYLAGFLIAQGCQLVTTRLLDTRRTLVVAFGLSAGIVQAVAPHPFLQALPALASPVSIGALVAFMVNFVTLPLVAQRDSMTVNLEQPIGLRLSDWLAGIAGSWGLKAQTARQVDHALGELAELLQARGAKQVVILARAEEERVEYALQWAGRPLPDPPSQASVDDLMGDEETRHRFSMWIATSQAKSYRQRSGADGHEAAIVFED